MTRHDMFVELASDNVSTVQQLILNGEYGKVHEWLQPLFIRSLREDCAEMCDDDLAWYYEEQLGVAP